MTTNRDSALIMAGEPVLLLIGRRGQSVEESFLTCPRRRRDSKLDASQPTPTRLQRQR